MSDVSLGITMADALVESRQKSIADFMISGGKHSLSRRKEYVAVQLNPRVHCHPLYNVLSKNRKIRVDIKDSIGDICCTRLQESCLIGGTALQNNHRDIIRNLSLVSFDTEGVLFVVCGANGLIRVFDFDECVASMVLNKTEPVVPLVRIDARKDIAHVCWSTDCPDEIAVCFSYYSQVYIYNLNQKDLNYPLKTLEVGHGGGEGGHHTCIYWSKKQQQVADVAKNGPYSPENEKIFASNLIVGSKSGHLRCWQLNRNTKKCAWSMVADPVMTSANAVTVVSLLILHDCRTLLSATASGVLVLWDLLHFQTSALGLSATPTPLHRIASGDLALYAYPSVELLSVGVRPTQNPIHTQAVESEVLLLTLSNGAVHLLDLFGESLLSSVQMATKSFGSEVRAVMPTWPNGCSVCVACSGASLEVLPLTTPSQRMAVNQHRAALLGPDHDRPSTASLYDSWIVKSNANLMRHCMDVAHTLPGKIISAEPGDTRVTTSHDLQMYLKTNGVVWFDWSASGIDTAAAGASASAASSEVDDLLKDLNLAEPVSKHTVDGVVSHRIALHQPYTGPSVAMGQPLVLIRTNLTPGKRVDDSNQPAASAASVTAASSVLPLASLNLSFQCTALSSHPSLPYLVAGADDGTVHILSPMDKSVCIAAIPAADSTSTSVVESVTTAKSEPSLLGCPVKLEHPDTTSVKRGNHINVWVRQGPDDALVSISKTEHSDLSLRLAFAVDTAAAIAASLDESAAVADEVDESEQGGGSVSLPSQDWYEAIYRDVIAPSVAEKLQSISSAAPVERIAINEESMDEFVFGEDDAAVAEEWDAVGVTDNSDTLNAAADEVGEEEEWCDRGSPLMVDLPNWRSASTSGSGGVQRPNQCSLSRQCEERRNSKEEGGGGVEVIDLENDPPNKEQQKGTQPKGVFSIFALQNRIASTAAAGGASSGSTRPASGAVSKLNVASLEKSQVKLLKGHKTNTLTSLINSKTSVVGGDGNSSATTSVIPAKRKAVSSFDALNTAQASRSGSLAPSMAGSFGSVMKDKTNKSILQSSILSTKASIVKSSASTAMKGLKSTTEGTSSGVNLKTFAGTLKQPSSSSVGASLKSNGGLKSASAVRNTAPPPTIGSLFHEPKRTPEQPPQM